MTRERWSDLSPRTRALIGIAGAVDGVLKSAALADLRRRPGAEVRGPKWLWAIAIVVVNSVGVVPVAYFVLGRQRGQ